MRYALDAKTGTQRVTAVPGANAICPGCHQPLIPRCGHIMVHHFAHKAKQTCGYEREPLTLWHQKWQDLFHPTQREVRISCPETYEFRRADILTSENQVIEIQYSPINSALVVNRNQFWKRITGKTPIWIINGERNKTDYEKLGQSVIRDDYDLPHIRPPYPNIVEKWAFLPFFFIDFPEKNLFVFVSHCKTFGKLFTFQLHKEDFLNGRWEEFLEYTVKLRQVEGFDRKLGEGCVGS